MWENETKQSQQAAALFCRPVQESSDAVLLVQSVLCLAAVIICVAVRAMLPGAWQELRTQGNAVLSSGIGFEEDTEFARFASAAFEQAEIALENTFGTLEETPGIGGFGPETDGEVPEGASLEEVSFEQVFQIPLRGTVTSGFGFRENPLTGKSEFHLGTDIAASAGTPVAAALSGQVCRTGYSAGRGNYIVIRHGNGIQTLYQHLECGFVRAGEVIASGQLIALSGQTGQVTGPHLHIEVLVDGICVNPACALPELSE